MLYRWQRQAYLPLGPDSARSLNIPNYKLLMSRAGSEGLDPVSCYESMAIPLGLWWWALTFQDQGWLPAATFNGSVSKRTIGFQYEFEGSIGVASATRYSRNDTDIGQLSRWNTTKIIPRAFRSSGSRTENITENGSATSDSDAYELDRMSLWWQSKLNATLTGGLPSVPWTKPYSHRFASRFSHFGSKYSPSPDVKNMALYCFSTLALQVSRHQPPFAIASSPTHHVYISLVMTMSIPSITRTVPNILANGRGIPRHSLAQV